jgi:hypothetical protein
MRQFDSCAAATVLIVVLGPIAIGSSPLAILAGGENQPGSSGTALYSSKKIQGWTVLVNKEFQRKQPRIAEQAVEQLEHQLYQIVRSVPAPAVKKLKTIRIWLEEKQPDNPCVIYRSNVRWLRDHGMNPDKAQCVEIANAANFIEWTLRQPWLVLHELAHGYHQQFLPGGYKNPTIEAAFKNAVDSKRYERVLRYNGVKEKAYALTNPTEFFAELTEAYFGTNDFYPFVRPEVREFDPETFAMLRELWGEK